MRLALPMERAIGEVTSVDPLAEREDYVGATAVSAVLSSEW